MVCAQLENENSSQSVNTSKKQSFELFGRLFFIIDYLINFFNTLIFNYKRYRINNELTE